MLAFIVIQIVSWFFYHLIDTGLIYFHNVRQVNLNVDDEHVSDNMRRGSLNYVDYC